MRRDSRGLLFACLFLLVYCVVRLGLHYNETIEVYWVEAPVAGPLPALTVAEPPPLSETALPPSARELWPVFENIGWRSFRARLRHSKSLRCFGTQAFFAYWGRGMGRAC